MWGEFKAFVNKGNVLDLAVGVLIGAAFGKIISSFTDDILMPLIGLLTGGGVDFSNRFILLGDPGDKVITTLAEAKAANIGVFAYGNFITALINFVILAFVIFSGEPLTLAPPTLDYGLVLRALRDAQLGVLKDMSAALLPNP